MNRFRSLGQALAAGHGSAIVLAFGAYVVICLLWQHYLWGGTELKTLIGNAFILPVNLWAIAVAARVSRCELLPRRVRSAWILIAIAFACNLVGSTLYLVLESFLHIRAFPSIADVGYLAFYPLMLWGLLRFPLVVRTREERSRFWFDAASVIVGSGMVIWHFIIRPTATTLDSEPLMTWLGVAYVGGDLVLLLGIVAILLRRPNPATRVAMYLLSAGLLCICAADIGFAYLSLIEAYEGGDWPDALWLVGMYLMAVGAHYQFWRINRRDSAETQEREGETPFAWLPHVMVGAGYGLFVWVVSSAQEEPIWELILGAAALTALMLARQVASARENSRLSAELTSRRSEARFRSLVQNLTDMIAVCDPSGALTYWSPSLLKAIAWESAPEPGLSLLSAVHPADVSRVRSHLLDVSRHAGVAPSIEFRLIRGGDEWTNVEAVASNLLADENVRGIVLNMRDISDRKTLEEQLTHQAFHDRLTGLANRALFHDRVQHAIARNARSVSTPAVLFVDIDDFKTINDSLGHVAGDQMLLVITERLRSCLRVGDTAARIGGDEFAVLLEDVRSTEDATSVAERLIETLNEPVRIQGRDVSIEASIGIALRSSAQDSADDLLRNADVALYSVKSRGKNRYDVFAPRMHEDVVNRLSVRSDLQGAVDRGEFRLHYQPIVSLETEELVGIEALVRWQHPVRGIIPPVEFIPLAEETGLIIPIGRWVLLEASRQIREWHDRFPSNDQPPLFMSVNLSARQLENPNLVDHVSEALLRANLDPSFLTLEITESLLMQHTELNMRKMRQLAALGVPLAVDDFGTGYSSLAYLRRFPVQILKIDKSFIDGIEDDPEAETLVRAIVSLGRALNLQIVAEGIEQIGQLRRLREMGCDKGQGFFFGKPLTAEELTDRLTRLPASLARRMSFGHAA